MKGRIPFQVRVVYVAPGAAVVVQARGVLLGSQRPGTVEVLAFLPVEGGDSRRLLDERFDWEGLPAAVGVALAKRHWARDLVPGDVVLAHAAGGTIGALVSEGRRFTRAQLQLSSFT